MVWRLAGSLVTLRSEINALAPNRSRLSDGTIGDPAHASRCSRHNPNDAGVVCALDITHDPAGGCDVHALARKIALKPHPNLEYIISNGQIAKRSTGFAWARYTGTNPHKLHAHFAVGVGSDCEPRPPYDDTRSWLPTPAQPPVPDDDDMDAEARQWLKDLHAWMSGDGTTMAQQVPQILWKVTEDDGDAAAIAAAVVASLNPSAIADAVVAAGVADAVADELRERLAA